MKTATRLRRRARRTARASEPLSRRRSGVRPSFCVRWPAPDQSRGRRPCRFRERRYRPTLEPKPACVKREPAAQAMRRTTHQPNKPSSSGSFGQCDQRVTNVEVGGEWCNQVARKHNLLTRSAAMASSALATAWFESTAGETALGERLGKAWGVGGLRLSIPS